MDKYHLKGMPMDNVILSSFGTDDFVECSRGNVKVSGKLFRKQILRWGKFRHPANPEMYVNVDRDLFQTMQDNFNNGVCPIVQVPRCDAQNRHTEDPSYNLGQVVGLEASDTGIDAIIDIRKNAEDVGSTLLGASAKMALNYMDRRTNKAVGPTLLHVAVTNRPYLTDLDDFEPIAMSDADTVMESTVLLTDGDGSEPQTKENPMTKEEMIASLSADYGIDVARGQEALAQVEGFVALSDVIGEGVVATPETVSQAIVDLTNSVQEREDRIQQLTAEINEVNLSKATAEVEAYITAGRILPKTKDAMIDLSMTDRERFELFLLPEKEAEAELSELGYTDSTSANDVDPAEHARRRGAALAEHLNSKKEG